MANIQYFNCRWCGREYRGGAGEWYHLCSKKCQTQFYREYPNQAKADLEQNIRDKEKSKRENVNATVWLIIIIGLFVYFFFFFFNPA